MIDSDETRRGASAAAAAGLLYVLLVFVGSAVIGGTSGAGRHSLDASESEVAEFVAGADPTRVWIGEFVAMLGYALFLAFAAYAWHSLRAGSGGWRDRTVVGAAVVYVALSAAGTACLAPAIHRGGDTAAAFLDLRTVLFAISFLFFAVWLVGVGVRAQEARTLPLWLAWAAIVIGLLLVLATPFAPIDPGFTGPPTFAGFLWVAAASVLLLLRERRVLAPL